MARKIILDVDTGSDDACAIILAYLHPEIDLLAVCSVSGNQPIDCTTENSLRVKELLNADFPVYKGCESPIVRKLIYPRVKPAENVDAYDEDGNKIHIHEPLFSDLPKSTGKYEEKSAAEFYVDYLRNAIEPITIVAVGPLTNLAIALMIDPSIVKNIEEIVIMGGGVNISNVSIASEFNIYEDPEAAQRVIHCGAKITMVPLDATHSAYISELDSNELKKINTPASRFVSSLIDKRIMVHDQCQPLEVKHSCALHDPLCIAYLIDENVLKDVRYCNVEIGLSGIAEGQTIVDQRYYQENRNVYFAFNSDSKKFSEIFINAFKG